MAKAMAGPMPCQCQTNAGAKSKSGNLAPPRLQSQPFSTGQNPQPNFALAALAKYRCRYYT